MYKYCIIEVEADSLPSHWDEIGVDENGRRILDVFDDIDAARSYVEESYGMYSTDASVEEIESLSIEWEDNPN